MGVSCRACACLHVTCGHGSAHSRGIAVTGGASPPQPAPNKTVRCHQHPPLRSSGAGGTGHPGRDSGWLRRPARDVGQLETSWLTSNNGKRQSSRRRKAHSTRMAVSSMPQQ